MSLVSVYIPTCARPRMLETALQSLKDQTYSPIEVLVCEDPSEVSCERVCESFSKDFHNFVYLKNRSRRGACYTRNKMIAAANGEYITGLDDDDFFEADRVRHFVEHMSKNEPAFLCSTSAPIGTGTEEWKSSERVDRWITFDDMKRGNPVGNQVFIRTEYLRILGGFDETLPAWQDFDLWFRATREFGAAYRIDNRSYRVNRRDDYARITNSTRARLAFDLFVTKHRLDLSNYDVARLRLGDHSNRGHRLPSHTFLRGIQGLSFAEALDILQRYGRYNIGRRFPRVKRATLSSFKDLKRAARSVIRVGKSC